MKIWRLSGFHAKGKYARLYCKKCKLIWGEASVAHLFNCTSCGAPLVLKSFNPWPRAFCGIGLIIGTCFTFLIPNMPVIWIGGFLWGGSMVINAFRQWRKVVCLDSNAKPTYKSSRTGGREVVIDAEVTASFVVCKRCGTTNRITSHDRHARPVCGRCRQPLPDPFSTKSRLASVLGLFNSFRYVALGALAVILIAIGTWAFIVRGARAPTPPSTTVQSPSASTTTPYIPSPPPVLMASDHRQAEKSPASASPNAVPNGLTETSLPAGGVPQSEVPVAFSKAEQPLPTSGLLFTSDLFDADRANCPFTLKTRSDNTYYLVKLEDWNSKRWVAMYFVYSGQDLDVKVPPGVYRLKYANGRHWYGREDLFGPETTVSMAASRLKFTEDTDGYSGHTVELIPQINGNLDTIPLHKRDF